MKIGRGGSWQMAKCDICKQKVENSQITALRDAMICDDCWEKAMGQPKPMKRPQMSREDIMKLLNANSEERERLRSNYHIEAYQENKMLSTSEYMGGANTEARKELFGNPIIHVVGIRGRELSVYEDFVVIDTFPSVGSVISGNATDGLKIIFYSDCLGIQYKEPGITIGYLQVETAASTMNNEKSNFFNENSFTFSSVNPEIRAAYEYIFKKVWSIKKEQYRKDSSE